MRKFAQLVIRFRIAILVFLAVITAGLGAAITQARLNVDVEQLFSADSDAVQAYKKVLAEFGSDRLFEVAFQSDDLFTYDFLSRLDQVVLDLEQIDGVDGVVAITNAPKVEASDGLLTVGTFFEEVASDADAAQMRSDMLSDQRFKGSLLSEEGDITGVVLEFSADGPYVHAWNSPGLLDDTTEIFKRHGFEDLHLYMVGAQPVETFLLEIMFDSLGKYLPISAVFVFTIVFIIFRRFWPVLLTALVAAMAVTWTMGVATLWDNQLTIFVMMVPILTLVISFSDVIHLVSCYLTDISQGKDHEQALLDTVEEVGKACMLTSLTTFIGFTSMATIPITAVRRMGVLMGFGVSVALLVALLLVPIFLYYFKPKAISKTGTTGVTRNLIGRFLKANEWLALRHPKMIVLGTAILMAVMSYGVSIIEVEADLVERFDPDHQIRISSDYVSEHLVGGGNVELFINTDEPGQVLEPEFLRGLQRLQGRIVDELHQVDGAGSLVDLMEVITTALDDNAPEQALPTTRPEAAQYLELFSMGGGSSLDRFINFPRDTVRVGVRLTTEGFFDLSKAADRIEEIAVEELPPYAHASATGLPALIGREMGFLLDRLIEGVAVAFVTIAIVMMISQRSFQIGLMSMIPNSVPLLFLFGWVSLTWDKFDTDVFPIAMVALGIAVDDTIHFLARYKIEYEKLGDRYKALSATYAATGRAIMQTTTVIIIGFLPLNLAPFFSIRMYGSLLGLTLFVAMLCDLLLLPALVDLGWLNLDREKQRKQALKQRLEGRRGRDKSDIDDP